MAERQHTLSLDATDQRLIELLRDNARLPTATLARHLDVSRGTVQNRIDRLIRDKVLLGFTVRLRGDAQSGMVRAITSLEVRSSDHKTVVGALKRIPEVTRVHSTNGRWDLVAEINTADLVTLDRVLGEIRSNRAISHSETSILLAEVA
ncbi:AsnC family transcriptional regulator [Skermanella stibiiresistens SB22]|uniref:AsnC family transcriptional regulator n=1 Tax=Skermanella stibiiresistens SB22 TaxID=1385369 RepID=W9GYR8_9PROT|nr:Lrp/AsnC family transcriptional regulator [Skermanella stibiiresistens]EWY38969.1 AsnC family transcriptional regulator [Skermanella stibiiresistens SB22]